MSSRAPNGPGWAEESQPMGYPTLAQPTHGFSLKKRPSPAHPWATHPLKKISQRWFCLLCKRELFIIVNYSFIS
jgi:hypothetical protein